MDEDSAKSTRERVLYTLLRQHRCTINDFTEAVDINPISVRHHIARLQADGYVSSEEERHGVGRPRRVYFLTPDGLEQFPTRYLRLTLRLLQQLKENVPASVVGQIFSQMAEDLVDEYKQDTHLKGLSMEERLDMVKELLTDEGFDIEWEAKGDQYHIREVSCPYFQVGQNHPEVCFCRSNPDLLDAQPACRKSQMRIRWRFTLHLCSPRRVCQEISNLFPLILS